MGGLFLEAKGHLRAGSLDLPHDQSRLLSRSGRRPSLLTTYSDLFVVESENPLTLVSDRSIVAMIISTTR